MNGKGETIVKQPGKASLSGVVENRLNYGLASFLLFAIFIFNLADILFEVLLEGNPHLQTVVETFIHGLALVSVLALIFYFFSHVPKFSKVEFLHSSIGSSSHPAGTFEEAFSYDRAAVLFSPRRLLPLMILSIFIAETAVMFLLHQIPNLTPMMEAFIDSTILLVILSPTFFFLHYQPLKRHYRERMMIAERLFASEQRFQMALKAVNDALWDYDPVSREIYVSPQCEIMLGYEPGEIGPKIDSWKDLLHPGEAEKFLQAKEDHLAGRSDQIRIEHRFRTKKGQWFWFLTRGQVVSRDKNNRPLRMVGTHTNITQRKQAEEALRKSKEDIRHLSHKLIYASEDEKKRLAQDLHDEFGQVLTAFQIGLEMLRNNGLRDEQEHDQQCNRLLSMVERLEVDLRQVCDQLRPVILDDLGLVETINWHIREFHQFNPNIDIEFNVNGKQALSREATIVLYRIFQEAMNNIQKHADASQVTINLDLQSGQIRLCVSDNGCGIQKSMKDKSSPNSWGLGLLGMRERAMAVGGKLDVDSESGKGTRVCAMIPS